MKTTKWNNQKTPGFKRMFVYLMAVSILCYCSCMFIVAGEPEVDAEAAKRARLVALLSEEAESEIQLEAWMMAIDMVEKTAWYADIPEEELELETWMLNIDLLDGPIHYAEINEAPLELEDWMFDICCWDVKELLAEK